jgi:hypothetical protein
VHFFSLRAFFRFSYFSVSQFFQKFSKAYFKLFLPAFRGQPNVWQANVLTLACCTPWLSIMCSMAGQAFGWKVK